MADEFQPGVCSNGSWWNAMRSGGGFDGSSAAMSGPICSVSCSAAVIDGMGGYGWTGATEAENKARSCDDSSSVASASGSPPVTFQDAHKLSMSVPMVTTTAFLMDASLPVSGFGLSSPTMDWSNHSLLRNNTGRGDNSIHAFLEEDMSSKPYYQQEAAAMDSNQAEDSTANLFKDMNQAFLLEQHHLNSGNHLPAGDAALSSFPVSSVLLQGLFESDLKPQAASYDTTGYRGLSSSEYSQPPWPKLPQFFKASQQIPTLKQQQQQQAGGGQLQFSNNTPFWNAPGGAGVHEARPGFYSTVNTQFITQQSSSSSSPATKSNSGGTRENSTTSASKKGCNEPSFKKPRIETPSPLPTFKVRKEKLGDRITALQQLVSPFGKTDTASVLYEAIEYIKFLHDQVNVLSTPYLKNGHPVQHQQNSGKSKDGEVPKQDLRSRGLCLVPISSTFPVANEPVAEFWTPTFGGSYR